MRQPKYESLKKHYPEHISLEQLSKICKIAKRSAKYLIEHGIIPSIDTGNKTWRYKIALDDVIHYLRRREQVGSMIPIGAVSSCTTPKTRKITIRKCFAQLVEPGKEADIAEYFEFIYADYDDILTSDDIAEMTGLEKSTVLRQLKNGAIKSVERRPRYLVPKPYFLKFVITPQFINYRTDSEHFKKVLGGFEIWLDSKARVI